MTVRNRNYALSLPELPFARPGGAKGDPKIASLSIRSVNRSKKNQSINGRIITRSSRAQWYELRLSYAPMHHTQISPIISFLEQCEGQHQEFRVPIFPLTGQYGLAIGQYVNFDNDVKLHMVTETTPTAVVTPPARFENGAMIIPQTQNPADVDTVYMVCSLKQDVQTVDVDNRGLVRLSLDLVERL